LVFTWGKDITAVLNLTQESHILSLNNALVRKINHNEQQCVDYIFVHINVVGVVGLFCCTFQNVKIVVPHACFFNQLSALTNLHNLNARVLVMVGPRWGTPTYQLHPYKL